MAEGEKFGCKTGSSCRRDFMELRASQGKWIVIMGDFNMRRAEVVGGKRGSKNKGGKVLVQWVELRDSLTSTCAIRALDMDVWGDEKCYGLHHDGGILREKVMLKMQLQDRGAVLKYQWTINSFASIYKGVEHIMIITYVWGHREWIRIW